jgi:hypothetical protein
MSPEHHAGLLSVMAHHTRAIMPLRALAAGAALHAAAAAGCSAPTGASDSLEPQGSDTIGTAEQGLTLLRHRIVGIGVGLHRGQSRTFAFYRLLPEEGGGVAVTAGVSNDLDSWRSAYVTATAYTGCIPGGPCRWIVDICSLPDRHLVFYSDGTYGYGPSDNLVLHTGLPYELPAGKTTGDVAAIGCYRGTSGREMDPTIVAWYLDGTYSVGAELGGRIDLDCYAAPRAYALPGGRTPTDVVSMDIAEDNGWAFAWYRDGYVSAGTWSNLGYHRSPYPYQL